MDTKYGCGICGNEFIIGEAEVKKEFYYCCDLAMVELPLEELPLDVCGSTDTAEHSSLDGGDPCDDGRGGI